MKLASRFVCVSFLAATVGFSLAACNEKEGPAEQAGKKVDQAVQTTTEAAKETIETTKEAAQNAVEETKSAAEQVVAETKEATEEAVEKVKEKAAEAGKTE